MQAIVHLTKLLEGEMLGRQVTRMSRMSDFIHPHIRL